MSRIQRWCVMCVSIALSLCALVGFSGANSSSICTITCSVKPSVEVTFNSEDCTWDLNPMTSGRYIKKGKLMVLSNTDWAITVKKDNATDGYMTEWKEDGYGKRRLSAPMKVEISGEKATLCEESDNLIIGTRTGSKPHEIEFAFIQTVTEEEVLQGKKYSYHMVVTFVGVAAEQIK